MWGPAPGRQRSCRVWTGVDEADGRAMYRAWLPADRHQAGKGSAVNWNEDLHSWCRGKLNRMHRRTQEYTNSVAMLSCSLALLPADWPAKSCAGIC